MDMVYLTTEERLEEFLAYHCHKKASIAAKKKVVPGKGKGKMFEALFSKFW